MSENQEQEQEAAATFSGTATDKDIEDIVRNPSAYGFEWDASWDAASRTDKDGKPFGTLLTLRKACATIPKCIDSEKFGAAFGGDKLTDAYNGTSGRVKAQEITRTLLLAEWDKQHAKNVTEHAIRVEVVKRLLLGMRAKGGGGGARKVFVVNGVIYANEADAIAASKVKVTYRALDGSEHATALEAKQHSVLWLVTEKNMPQDMAAQIVANMPE